MKDQGLKLKEVRASLENEVRELKIERYAEEEKLTNVRYEMETLEIEIEELMGADDDQEKRSGNGQAEGRG